MTTYPTLSAARAAVKKATGHAPTKYVIRDKHYRSREVSALEFRCIIAGETNYYREGQYAVAEKVVD